MTTSNIPSEIRGVSTFIVKTIVNMIVSMPFLIFALVILHVWALHVPGNNNPEGIDVVQGSQDTVPFHPHYVVKDGLALVVFLVIFAGFVNLEKSMLKNFFLISFAVSTIYLFGLPWLAYLKSWEIAYIYGFKQVILSDLLKIALVTVISKQTLKIRNLI